MDPALPEFLRSSEVYVSANGKSLTVYSDGFGHIMLSTPTAIKHLSEAFALAKITDGRADVKVIKKAVAKKESSPADELGGLL